MAILARLGVNVAANIGFQFSAELLPTVVRAQGVSLIHIIGYFAHIIGPYVIYLVSISRDTRERESLEKFFSACDRSGSVIRLFVAKMSKRFRIFRY